MRRRPILSLCLLLVACGSSLPPLSTMLPGPRLEERRAHLETHPELDPTLYRAVHRGEIAAGMDRELVEAVLGAPDTRRELDGLYDLELAWTGADTTWVFLKDGRVNAVDGTSARYRFPSPGRRDLPFRWVMPRTQGVRISLLGHEKQWLADLLVGDAAQGEHVLDLKWLEPKDEDMPLRGTFRAGRHELDWNRRDAAGEELPDGLYYLRLVSNDRDETRRFTLLR